MVRYVVDAQASRFTARAFAGGPLSAMGHDPTFAIRDLRGEVEYDPASPETASLRLVAGAGSLSLIDDTNDKDRREIERTTRDQVLESHRYPEITYECPRARVAANGGTQVTLSGNLTLHGVSRPQIVAARLYLNGHTLRGQGETSLRPSDFGIRPVTVAGGMLKTKDEVKLTFDIVARK